MGLEDGNGNGSLFAMVTINGNPDRLLSDWLEYIRMFKQEGEYFVILGQFLDQSALRGFLDQLWNLNFTLCSVESVEY